MARDTVRGTFLVALVLCIVCSVLVSSAAVLLRPRQEANKELDRKKNILVAAGLAELDTPASGINTRFESVETALIDLQTGKPVTESEIDFSIANYEPRDAAMKPSLSTTVDPPEALHGIARREKYAFVYLVREGEQIETIVLPIYGKGLWSTLFGFLALDGDLQTIQGITFYQHGETPGLGGEVDNPAWKALWPGKKAFDEDQQLVIRVIKGAVNPENPTADFQVDGLSGATITTRGVSDLVRYWLGPDAFGPYLEHLRSGDADATANINLSAAANSFIAETSHGNSKP